MAAGLPLSADIILQYLGHEPRTDVSRPLPPVPYDRLQKREAKAIRKAKDALDKAVKDGEVGEDEGARGEKDLDAMTKKHVDLIEEMAKNKEQELLEV